MMAEQTAASKAPVTGGGFQEIPQDLLSLAMAYVPRQKWQNIYDAKVGLARGTIFADLDKPFIGEEAVRRDGT